MAKAISILVKQPVAGTTTEDGQVCYTFPGSSEVCVTGESYEVVAPSHQGGQCTNKGYKIDAWANLNNTQITACNTPHLCSSNDFTYNFAIKKIENLPVTTFGNVLQVRLTKADNSTRDIGLYGDYDVNGYYRFVRYAASCGNWGDVSQKPWTASAFYNFSVRRVDGTTLANDIAQCGTLSTTLKVKNSLGVVISTITGSGTPTVRLVAGKSSTTCRYGGWDLAKKLFLNPKEQLEIRIATILGNKITRVIKSSLDPNDRKKELVYSATGTCNYPLVKLIDTYVKDKCPDGTCAITCSDHICCYDKNGKVIKTIYE